MENATILRADQDHCSGIWRNVLIYVWRNVTRPDAVEESRRYVEGHIAKARGPLAMVIITEAQSQMPDGPTREKLAAVLTAMAPAATCAAMVHEQTGFRGAAVRGIVTVLNTLARQPFPYKSFGDVETASSWMATIHTDGKGAIAAADLIGVVGRLRSSTVKPIA
jgi:hypothetical protein